MGRANGAGHDRPTIYPVRHPDRYLRNRMGSSGHQRRATADGERGKDRARIRKRHGDIAEAQPPAEVRHAVEGIIELLSGKPNDLGDVVLDLDGVPEFNRGVYEIARSIPPGKTMTYGDIAKQLGGVELHAMSARRLGAIPVRSWCRVTAYLPQAASRAVFPPMAALSPS